MRKVTLGRATVILLIALACSLEAFGQRQSEPTPKNEFAVWGARSFSNGHVFGFAQGRSLTRVELRYGRLLWTEDGIALRYVVDVVPLALVGEPRAVLPNGNAAPGTPRDSVYGGGLSPVGAQMNFFRTRRLQPFLSSNGGFLYFSRTLLTPGATQFNFTVNVAGGFQFAISPHGAIDIGYMYHHFSNANLGARNPGLDAHMIFAGISVLR